jgi:hypothetical protein
MDWVWILGVIFSVWAVLRVIGAERQRRVHELIIQIAVQQAEEPPRRIARPTPPVAPATPAPSPSSAPPVHSKATR